MITLTYEQGAHPGFIRDFGSYEWSRLKQEGWDVEYEDPYYYDNCGIRATKEFPSLVQGVCEWEAITNADPFYEVECFRDHISMVEGDHMNVRYVIRPAHIFKVTDDTGTKELTGDDLMRALKARF